MKKENINFFKKINLKTNWFLRLFPNLGEKSGPSFDFSDYFISKENFEKIIKIIKEESLLVETRFAELYCVYNSKKQTILQFSKKNITKEMEKILFGLTHCE